MVFTAVPEEVGQLLKVDYTVVSRYDVDGLVTVAGGWASTDPGRPLAIGLRLKPEGRNIHALVFQTGQPTRIDDYGTASGAFADVARDWQYRSSVGVPISVEGRLWGVMIAGSREESLPADTEARLAGFTELVATAIAEAQARVELRGFAEEQAALRRVATLVAQGAPPEKVFSAVAEEARLLGTDSTVMSRYDPDGAAMVVGVWDGTGAARVIPVGLRLGFGGQNLHTLVFQTGRPGRIDDYAAASGDAADAARGWGFRSAVGVPISVEDRLWGVMSVASAREEPLSADTEERLAAFTELIVTALVNAEAQAALNASRARIVAAADETRRRLERDLHDGIQQRLVSLALKARTIETMAPQPAGEIAGELSLLADGLGTAMDELREISHGIHPAIGADPGRGSGIIGLKDRVEALGGTISMLSPPGHGTALHVQLPANPMVVPALPGRTP